MTRRACIVTAGGDAPGLNAVVRAFAHRSQRLGTTTFACHGGFEGLLTPGGITALGIDAVRGILPLGGSSLGCSTRVYPFLDPERDMPGDRGPAMVDRLKSSGMDILVCVGGDGTMRAAWRFHRLGMSCIGVPKTIDCDLAGSDATCGHDTAVETVTSAIDALHATAESHQRVLIVEAMGRNAGYIALRAGIAGGADAILIPEIPYDVARVAGKIREREAHGLKFSIIVIGEGARPAGGAPSVLEAGTPGKLPRLGGAGERLRRELEAMDLGHEVRVTVLGHLQRGGRPVASDRLLATRLGVRAAELAHDGRGGTMVAVRGGDIEVVPLEETVCARAAVDPNGELAHVARGIGIELGG